MSNLLWPQVERGSTAFFVTGPTWGRGKVGFVLEELGFGNDVRDTAFGRAYFARETGMRACYRDFISSAWALETEVGSIWRQSGLLHRSATWRPTIAFGEVESPGLPGTIEALKIIAAVVESGYVEWTFGPYPEWWPVMLARAAWRLVHRSWPRYRVALLCPAQLLDWEPPRLPQGAGSILVKQTCVGSGLVLAARDRARFVALVRKVSEGLPSYG